MILTILLSIVLTFLLIMSYLTGTLQIPFLPKRSIMTNAQFKMMLHLAFNDPKGDYNYYNSYISGNGYRIETHDKCHLYKVNEVIWQHFSIYQRIFFSAYHKKFFKNVDREKNLKLLHVHKLTKTGQVLFTKGEK